MKLLFCPKCFDVFKLTLKPRSCDCGEVKGQYIDNINAEVNGKGFSLAIGNGSLVGAINRLSYGAFPCDSSSGVYISDNSVICWVRPHEGEANPHTKIKATK